MYGNVDPVNHVDPSGNFSLGSISAASSIRSTLSNIQINVGFGLLDAAIDPDNAASNAGSSIAFGIASLGGKASFKLLRILSGKFRKVCKLGNSFNSGTLVSTEFGLKEIQHIQIGEYVWAYNEKTGQRSLQEVVHLIQGEGLKELVDIQLASGNAITATAGHPFYTPDKSEGDKWTDAGQLTINDILQKATNSKAIITSLYEHKELAIVYNLTVANDHTYFVGTDGILGHNANICKKTLIKAAKLPTKGKIRYVPPKGWQPANGLPGNLTNGFKDKFGNLWKKGPSRTTGQSFEWDVQLSKTGLEKMKRLRNGRSHLNVSLDGKITH